VLACVCWCVNQVNANNYNDIWHKIAYKPQKTWSKIRSAIEKKLIEIIMFNLLLKCKMLQRNE